MLSYSSAVLRIIPTTAVECHRFFSTGNTATCERLLQEIDYPFADISDCKADYALPAVKMGVRRWGLGSGWIRAPLMDLTGEEEKMLRGLTGDRMSAPDVAMLEELDTPSKD